MNDYVLMEEIIDLIQQYIFVNGINTDDNPEYEHIQDEIYALFGINAFEYFEYLMEQLNPRK